MKKENLIYLLVISLIVLGQAAMTFGQSGGAFQIKRSLIASGGGITQNGTFSMKGTIGQAVAGTKMESISYSIGNGFWGDGAALGHGKMRFDFDGDSKADMALFRPADGIWHIQRSTQGYAMQQFGLANDKLVPADYDGDNKADIAIYRDGVWFVLNSSNGSLGGGSFGLAGDIPVPGIFDADWKDDLAVFRPSTGTWYV